MFTMLIAWYESHMMCTVWEKPFSFPLHCFKLIVLFVALFVGILLL